MFKWGEKMKNTFFMRLRITAFVVILLFLGAAGNALAANFTVTKTADTNDGVCDADCSLREAVTAANSAGSSDTIGFAPSLSGTTLTLSLGVEIVIVGNGTLTIDGLGANRLTISGGAGTNRIFFINGAGVAINGLTFTGGNGVGTNGGFGGAIFVFNGAAQFDSVHFTGNFASTAGGGIYFSGGTHSVLNSTFSNNTGANAGGLATDASASVSISNSTFSGNNVTSSGGALGFIGGSTATLRNVTVSGNSGANGGGIFVSGGTLNFGNTIVAGNTGGFPEILFAAGTVTSAGNNLVGDSAGDSANTGTPIAYQGSDLQNISPQLMALGNYGGPTPTRALQFSSPARNNGSDGLAIAAGLVFDQRGAGFLRFIGTVDIGAFEAQDQRFYVTKAANSLDGSCNDDCSLREAVAAAPNGAAIDFSRDLSGQTLTLGGSEIIINKVLTIDGFGANLIEISGSAASRIFAVTAPVTFRITGVKLSNGNGNGVSAGFGGAVFVNGGNLILDAADVTNNTASTGGGVFIANSTNSRIAYSTISFNTSSNSCGGVSTFATTLFVVNSTFSDNTAANVGGGLCLDNSSSGTLRNVTIAGNSANFGGGISVFGSTLNFGNTIVAANFAVDDPEISFFSGTVTSAGDNLVGDSAGDAQNTNLPITFQPSDILNTPPVIGPLTIANGGTTPTRALGPTSPAVDQGNNALAVDSDGSPLLIDQRGFSRIVDGNFDSNAVVDIGAYEFASLAPTAAGVTISGRVLDPKGNGVIRAKVSITDSQGNVRTAQTNSFGRYSFEGVAVGETYIISVFAKAYQYDPQVVTVTDELAEIDFIPQE
jgi:CSLREA domain-containing protein